MHSVHRVLNALHIKSRAARTRGDRADDCLRKNQAPTENAFNRTIVGAWPNITLDKPDELVCQCTC